MVTSLLGADAAGMGDGPEKPPRFPRCSPAHDV
jgi:hypothetical protein